MSSFRFSCWRFILFSSSSHVQFVSPQNSSLPLSPKSHANLTNSTVYFVRLIFSVLCCFLFLRFIYSRHNFVLKHSWHTKYHIHTKTKCKGNIIIVTTANISWIYQGLNFSILLFLWLLLLLLILFFKFVFIKFLRHFLRKHKLYCLKHEREMKRAVCQILKPYFSL
jgi:hypothetical protein